MLHHEGNSGSKVREEWHRRREEARKNAHDIVEFDEIEQEKFDLETARIGEGDHRHTTRIMPYTGEPEDISETNPRI